MRFHLLFLVSFLTVLLSAAPSRAVSSSDYDYILSVKKQCVEMLKAKKFDALEAWQENFKSKKVKFKDGSWMLYHFYDAVSTPDDSEAADQWPERMALLKEWYKVHPGSLPAYLSLAQFYVAYAWRARGRGFSDSVTAEAQARFEERLKNALLLLNGVQRLGHEKFDPLEDPQFAYLRILVGKGLGSKKGRLVELMARAQKAAPDYFYVQRAFSSYLLPRWYGESGDWEKYALESADSSKELGDEMYFRIVSGIAPSFGIKIFKETEANWAKAKSGLLLMEARYPGSLLNLHEGAFLAVCAEDKPLAKRLFTEIDGRWIPSVWPNRLVFNIGQAWALDKLNTKQRKEAEKHPMI